MYHASLVIPTYNRSKLLEMTLNSLSKQSNSEFRFEVIVVDDGSDDDTRQIVKYFKRKIEKLRYYYQKNKGFRVARARNIGIKKSRGDLIIFVDSGVVVSESFVYEHCKAHGYKQNLAVIGTVYGFQATLETNTFFDLYHNDDLQGTFLRFRNEARFLDPRHNWFKNFNFDLKNVFAPWLYFWTCNVSVKKNLLISAGLFDENYNSWGVEDLDLGFRLLRKNVSFIISKHADAIHYPHCTISEVEKKNNSSNSNLIYFHKKYSCIETEMCLGGKGPIIDKEIIKLWSGWPYEMFDFNGLNGANPFSLLKDKKVLVIGGGNGSILEFIDTATVLETNKYHIKDIISKYPKIKTFNLLGANTPFGDKEYDIVFITDFFKHLSPKWLSKIIQESLRISSNVYVLYGVTAESQTELLVNQERIDECIKIVSENDKLYKEICISSGDVVLNVIEIYQ